MSGSACTDESRGEHKLSIDGSILEKESQSQTYISWGSVEWTTSTENDMSDMSTIKSTKSTDALVSTSWEEADAEVTKLLNERKNEDDAEKSRGKFKLPLDGSMLAKESKSKTWVSSGNVYDDTRSCDTSVTSYSDDSSEFHEYYDPIMCMMFDPLETIVSLANGGYACGVSCLETVNDAMDEILDMIDDTIEEMKSEPELTIYGVKTVPKLSGGRKSIPIKSTSFMQSRMQKAKDFIHTKVSTKRMRSV
jgi:hypothetical protein